MVSTHWDLSFYSMYNGKTCSNKYQCTNSSNPIWPTLTIFAYSFIGWFWLKTRNFWVNIYQKPFFLHFNRIFIQNLAKIFPCHCKNALQKKLCTNKWAAHYERIEKKLEKNVVNQSSINYYLKLKYLFNYNW